MRFLFCDTCLVTEIHSDDGFCKVCHRNNDKKDKDKKWNV